MKRLAFLLTCLAIAFSAASCDKSAAQPASDGATAIEVPKEGKKFEPPIKPEQLPAGAWYCDMGTVHWASMDKPADGKCPECGMALKQSGEAHGHDHDHEGGEDGHKH